MLKIDVEGMEAAVADGARRTIAAFKPMVFYEDNSDAGSRADLTSPRSWRNSATAATLERNLWCAETTGRESPEMLSASMETAVRAACFFA